LAGSAPRDDGRVGRRRAVREVQDRAAPARRLLRDVHDDADGEGRRPRARDRPGGRRGAAACERDQGARGRRDRRGLRRRRLHGALPQPEERPRPAGGAMTMRSRSVGSPDATRAVDWEQRIDFDRLRRERLQRAKDALEASDLGALLLFDPNNIRYVTSTHIGEWARDKNARFALLPRGADPILWDFGSAARHHQLFAPWLPPENFRAGVAPMRGAMPVETGIPDRLGERIAHELR